MSNKNKKSKIKFGDIEVDSQEEWQWFHWLEEAKALGIVISYEYQPEPFVITDKFTYIPQYNNPKNKTKSLLRAHIYTADFKMLFNADFGEQLANTFTIAEHNIKPDGIEVWLDIKGSWNRYGGDRLMSIHQKLVYDKYQIFIEKLVPRTAFITLGLPKACRYTPTGRTSKIYTSYNFIDKVFNLR